MAAAALAARKRREKHHRQRRRGGARRQSSRSAMAARRSGGSGGTKRLGGDCGLPLGVRKSAYTSCGRLGKTIIGDGTVRRRAHAGASKRHRLAAQISWRRRSA